MKYLNKKHTTRFAPSLTGKLHLGNIRVAFLNWFVAIKSKGLFIFRIEDSNVINSNSVYTTFSMVKVLRYLKMGWGQGPCFQSDRSTTYLRYLKKFSLLNKVTLKRGALWLLTNTKKEFISVNFLTELKVLNKNYSFIIFKGSGKPVFNFVNPVDDIDMGVSFIIRGDDHVDNTKKQSSLFYFLRKKLPAYVHVPLVLFNTGVVKSKMSKRSDLYSLGRFIQKGYLRETLEDLLLYKNQSHSKKNFFEMLKSKDGFSIDFKKLSRLNRSFLERSSSTEALFSMLNYLKVNKASLIKSVCSKLESLKYIGKKGSYLGYLKFYRNTTVLKFKPCRTCIKLIVLRAKSRFLTYSTVQGPFFSNVKLKGPLKGILFDRLFTFESLKGVSLDFLYPFANKKLLKGGLQNKLKVLLDSYTKVVLQ